jgi:hypothetical protein
MKRTLVILAILVLSACSPAAPSIVVNVNANVNVVTTVNFSSPIPASDPGCAAIGSIEINRPESLAVGTTGDLLITPKDSSGQKRTPQCDIADGITLSANPTDVLSIEDPRAFVTKVKGGPKTGTAKLKVTVGRAEASVDIPVR